MICDPPEEALPLAGLPAPEQQHVVGRPLLRRGGETQDVVRGVGVQTHLHTLNIKSNIHQANVRTLENQMHSIISIRINI